MSRLYLDGDLSLGSNGELLAGSDSVGRVLVVSAEGTSPKILNEYLANLQTERDAQIAQVHAKYESAKKLMKGQ